MWLLILPLFPVLYSQNRQYPFITILESTFLFPLPTASYLWRLYNPIIADMSQWLLSPFWITDWDWGARKAFTTYSAYTPLRPIVSPQTSRSAFSNLRACLELEASSVTSSICVSRWTMFSPKLLLVQQLAQQVHVAGIIWTTSQLFSAKSLPLSVPIDMGKVSFPLTGTVTVRPSYCFCPIVLVGFLGGWPFFVARGTALVGGWRFLFRLFLRFLGWFALDGSRRRVTIGVVVNLGLLGDNLLADAFAMSLSGRPVVIAHALKLGECSGSFGTDHRLGL